MKRRLRLGISTCPNDTFAFHALLAGAIPTPGLELEIELLDVQELNEALACGRFDVAKGSFYAAFMMSAELCVLRSGAALGFGNGPLLLGTPQRRGEGVPERILGPGRWTTAHLLYKLFHGNERGPEVEHLIFSEIMPALVRGEANLGICIHEGRFTFEEHGLECLEDLGATWEAQTALPLPLGGIFARRTLGPETIAAVEAAIGASIRYAREHPDSALVSMREHAQETSDEVLTAHVELYVNEHTEALGELGGRALRRLEAEARRIGAIPPESPALEIFGD